MMQTTTPAAESRGPRDTVTIAGSERKIERVSARKASVALSMLRGLSRLYPEVMERREQFMAAYREQHFDTFTRAHAKLQFGPLVLRGADGNPVIDPDGAPVLLESRLANMSEEDWQQSGGVLKIPREAPLDQQIAAVFDYALEHGEDQVYRLLALFLMPNSDVKAYRRDGSLSDQIDRLVDEVLDDAYADEILELAVVCGEVVNDQFVERARKLQGRMGNALRLLGVNPNSPTTTTGPATPDGDDSSDGPSSTTPYGSTDSPAPTDGDPTTSSTSHSSSSSSSATSSEPTPS